VLKKLVYYEAIDPLIEIAASDDPAVYEVALGRSARHRRSRSDRRASVAEAAGALDARPAPGRCRTTLLIVCEKQPAGADRAEPVLKALSGVDLTRSALHLPLLGRLGGPQALKIIDAALRSDDAPLARSGGAGICNWPDASVADRLLALAATRQNARTSSGPCGPTSA
jgi:hypothetical protein